MYLIPNKTIIKEHQEKSWIKLQTPNHRITQTTTTCQMRRARAFTAQISTRTRFSTTIRLSLWNRTVLTFSQIWTTLIVTWWWWMNPLSSLRDNPHFTRVKITWIKRYIILITLIWLTLSHLNTQVREVFQQLRPHISTMHITGRIPSKSRLIRITYRECTRPTRSSPKQAITYRP